MGSTSSIQSFPHGRGRNLLRINALCIFSFCLLGLLGRKWLQNGSFINFSHRSHLGYLDGDTFERYAIFYDVVEDWPRDAPLPTTLDGRNAARSACAAQRLRIVFNSRSEGG